VREAGEDGGEVEPHAVRGWLVKGHPGVLRYIIAKQCPDSHLDLVDFAFVERCSFGVGRAVTGLVTCTMKGNAKCQNGNEDRAKLTPLRRHSASPVC
jgi:hypothetical protein